MNSLILRNSYPSDNLADLARYKRLGFLRGAQFAEMVRAFVWLSLAPRPQGKGAKAAKRAAGLAS